MFVSPHPRPPSTSFYCSVLLSCRGSLFLMSPHSPRLTRWTTGLLMPVDGFCSQCWTTQTTVIDCSSFDPRDSPGLTTSLSVCGLLSARKKQSSASPPGPASKRYWADSTNAALIDPNIENISANMNRVDSERLLAAATKKLAAAAEGYFSSEESNDNESLPIDQENV